MKVSSNRPETVAEIRAKANEWYAHQVELLRGYHGAAWLQHEEWLCGYLKAEVRERLIARGWRPRDGN